MKALGLTGSIGMGKSTVAAMLETLGVPVHCADDAVHALLAPGGPGARALENFFPQAEFPRIYGAKTKTGTREINRQALGEIVFQDERLRERLESLLHPLVREDQNAFLRTRKSMGAGIAALDIPLLFETGREGDFDAVLVVTAPPDIQRARVMARPGMTEEKFDAILRRQMPDKEKCIRADYIIQTGLGRADTMRQVQKIVLQIREPAP